MILMNMLMSALICSLSGSRLSEYIRAVLAVSDHLPTNSFFVHQLLLSRHLCYFGYHIACWPSTVSTLSTSYKSATVNSLDSLNPRRSCAL